MEPLTIKLTTRTPLWMGGVKMTTDRLHETGIIGSLRWWYEVIVRGLGGNACDPTNDKQRCPTKLKNGERIWCDVCEVFGMTGLKRMFSIGWNNVKNPYPNERLNVKVTNRNARWYQKRGLLIGKDELEGIMCFYRSVPWANRKELQQTLNMTFAVAEKQGGFAARSQQGYGVIEVNTKPSLDVDAAINGFKKLQTHEHRRSNIEGELPNLRGCFFTKVQFRAPTDVDSFLKYLAKFQGNLQFYLNNNVLPIAPVIRYHLRGLIRDHLLYNGHSNAAVRWHLMGVLNGLYHHRDFGKIVDVEWKCSKCGRTWNHRPNWNEHQNCKGHPFPSKWECLSCKKPWSNNPAKSNNLDAIHIEKQSSLIQVSHAYLLKNGDYEFRIWGCLPPQIYGNVQREEALSFIAHAMKWRQGAYNFPYGELWNSIGLNPQNPQVASWREFNSNRDNSGKIYTDPYEFLRGLVSEEEKSK